MFLRTHRVPALLRRLFQRRAPDTVLTFFVPNPAFAVDLGHHRIRYPERTSPYRELFGQAHSFRIVRGVARVGFLLRPLTSRLQHASFSQFAHELVHNFRSEAGKMLDEYVAASYSDQRCIIGATGLKKQPRLKP